MIQNYFGQPQQRNSWLGDRLSIPDAGYAPQYFGAQTLPRLPDVSSGYFGDPNAVDPQSAGATGGGGTNPYAAAALSVGPLALSAANWATGALRADGKNLATLGKEYIKGTDIYKSMVGDPPTPSPSSGFGFSDPPGLASQEAVNSTFGGMPTTGTEALGDVTGFAPEGFTFGAAPVAEGGLGLSGGLGAASEFGAGGFAGVTPAASGGFMASAMPFVGPAAAAALALYAFNDMNADRRSTVDQVEGTYRPIVNALESGGNWQDSPFMQSGGTPDQLQIALEGLADPYDRNLIADDRTGRLQMLSEGLSPEAMSRAKEWSLGLDAPVAAYRQTLMDAQADYPEWGGIGNYPVFSRQRGGGGGNTMFKTEYGGI
jgi:hypothetical protein